MGRIQKTPKQRQMMAEIFRSFENGKPITPGELRLQLPGKNGCTAMSSSLKYLEQKGMIVRSYVNKRRIIHPTDLGYAFFGRRPI